MKKVNNSTLRGSLAIVLGLLLVLWPEAAVNYLVMTIGVLFIIPGIISMLAYFTRNTKEEQLQPLFPVEGAGSILLGIWLIIMPGFFVGILMYVLGALLVIAGIQQIVTLIIARKWSVVPVAFYLVPVCILLTGAAILAYPFETAANTFIIFGVASLFYGITELFNGYKFRKREL